MRKRLLLLASIDGRKMGGFLLTKLKAVVNRNNFDLSVNGQPNSYFLHFELKQERNFGW